MSILLKHDLVKWPSCCCVVFYFFFFYPVQLSVRAHEEQRICLIWVDIFKSVKHLSTKANKARPTALRYASQQQIKQCWTDYRLLSNVDSFYQTKAETNVFYWGAHGKCLFSHVKHNHACQVFVALRLGWSSIDLCCRIDGPLCLPCFSWKTMLSLHSLTAPRGWCGGEGTCPAKHITCSSDQNRTQLEIQF